MENNNMCNCVEPPKGLQPAPPTMENAAEYKAAYGEIVLAQLVGQYVAEAPVSFRGPATRVSYGRRAKGDIFYIWQADLENSGDTFAKVENYSVEPEHTVMPPEPEPLRMSKNDYEAATTIIEEAKFEPLPPFDATEERESKPVTPSKPTGKSSIAREARAKSLQAKGKGKK